MTFATLGLTEPLLRTLADLGQQIPTPVQAKTIPVALAGHDVTVQAQTGSGKTAAFALPLLQQFLGRGDALGSNEVRALVLVPTRELARQVAEQLRQYGRQLPLRLVTAHGGVSINPQMMALRPGAHVLVATPGRLLDLLAHRALVLDRLSLLVLDEADKLLDLGFADEVGALLAQLPRQRQSLFFSATFPPPVRELAARLLHQPRHIESAANAANSPDIRQRAIVVDPSRRTQLLRHLLQTEAWRQALVFVASQYACELVAHKLGRAGIEVAALHGGLSQERRNQVVADFRAGHLTLLIATDVAARGLDIAQLPVVVNYDLPRATADYIHRIGRTGRAGAPGLAISFLDADNEGHFRLIEKRQDQRLPREQIPGFEPTLAPTVRADRAPALADNDPNHPANGGIKGKRKSKKDKLREAAARNGPAPTTESEPA
ncbi:DEAD/DEAH box helicase [Denitratisoma sp. agr-D3]